MRSFEIAFVGVLGCAAAAPAQDKREPAPFEARGRLVCLLEEMKRDHKAEIDTVHDHLLGFRVEEKQGPVYFTVLRNRLSKALFLDPRYKDRELRLRGRVFPGTSILEVTRFQWYRDGKLHDVYYWCEVCSIRDVDPGLCMCCQAPVEFREQPAQEKP